MLEERKTKAELLKELSTFRARIVELEQSEHKRRSAEGTLRKSEEKYHSLVTNIPDVVWTTDSKGNTTFVSPNVEKIYGYSPEEIYEAGDRLWFGRVHPDAVEKVKEAYKALFKEGIHFDIEYRVKRKDGQWIWLRDRSTVTYKRDGVLYADGIFSDVTKRKQMEEQLKKSEQRFRAIFDNAADGILLADMETKKFHSGNKMICQMLRYNQEEIRNLGAMDIHPAEDLPYIIEQFEKQGKVEFTLAKNIPVKRKNGSVFYADINSIPITLGGKTYLMGIFRDITERRKAEEELDRYREKMARVEQLAALGTLSATLAHELTQPLTVIRLSIESALGKLETKSCPETITKKLKNCLADVSNATSIVDRLRNFARKSSERIVREVDLKAIVGRIVTLLNESAQRGKFTLSLKSMDKLPLIYSDEKELEQLFFPLVDNAIQAADGKKNRELIISSTVKDKHIELQFADNCGGIAPENLDRIFGPFFTTKPAGKGTGLGLCVVQHIATRVGGKVRVESKPGKGSTFFVTLPINRGKKS